MSNTRNAPALAIILASYTMIVLIITTLLNEILVRPTSHAA
jgi:hypothetical protein